MSKGKSLNRDPKKNWMTFQEYRATWIREHGAARQTKGKTTFFDRWLAFGYKGGRVLARLGLSANGVSYLAILTAFLSAAVIMLTGLVLAPVTPSLLVQPQFGWPGAFLPPMGFLLAIYSDYNPYKPQLFLAALLLILAFALLLLSAWLDVLDGAVARLTRVESPWGSYFEQVLDKYADAVVLIALIVTRFIDLFWGVLALFGFIMVDYARARHQADGLQDVRVTIGERPFRILFLATAAGMQVLAYLAIVFTVVIPITPTFYVHQLTLEAIRYFTFLLAILSLISVIQISAFARKRLPHEAHSKK